MCAWISRLNIPSEPRIRNPTLNPKPIRLKFQVGSTLCLLAPTTLKNGGFSVWISVWVCLGPEDSLPDACYFGGLEVGTPIGAVVLHGN